MANSIVVPEELAPMVAKNGYQLLRKYAEAVDTFHRIHGSDAKQDMQYWREQAREFLKDPSKHFSFKEHSGIILKQKS